MSTQRAAHCYHKSHTLTLSPCGNITAPTAEGGHHHPLYISPKGSHSPWQLDTAIFPGSPPHTPSRTPPSRCCGHFTPLLPLATSYSTSKSSGIVPQLHVPVPCHHFSSLVESTILLLLGLLCNPHPLVLEATGWGLHCSSERGLGHSIFCLPNPQGMSTQNEHMIVTSCLRLTGNNAQNEYLLIHQDTTKFW